MPERLIYDIMQGPAQGASAMEWAMELQTALRRVNAVAGNQVNALVSNMNLREQLTAVTAERDTLQAWLKTAPLDAIVVLSELVDHPYSGSSMARVANEWASNQDMRRYVATLRRL